MEPARRESRGEAVHADNSSMNSVNGINESNLDILQNSQAFARITELAFKAGAIDNSSEYFKSANCRLVNFIIRVYEQKIFYFRYVFLTN